MVSNIKSRMFVLNQKNKKNTTKNYQTKTQLHHNNNDLKDID